jgi:hypothetical protein
MSVDELNFQRPDLERQYKSGARWFFWIAGLTLLTSILSLMGSNVAFFLSLGSTQFVDGIAIGLSEELGQGAKVVGIVIDVLIAGVFVLLGWFALKRHMWSFIVGIILFALDALILLYFQIWISLIFHALVIFWIFRGYQAARRLAALEVEARVIPPAPPPPPDFSQPDQTGGPVAASQSGAQA